MTAINIATDIPPGITELGQLSFWSLLSLHNLNKGVTYKEATGNAVDSGLAPVIDISIVGTADNLERAICRTSFELNPAWKIDTAQKLWMFVQAFSESTLPPAYKVD